MPKIDFVPVYDDQFICTMLLFALIAFSAWVVSVLVKEHREERDRDKSHD